MTIHIFFLNKYDFTCDIYMMTFSHLDFYITAVHFIGLDGFESPGSGGKHAKYLIV